MKRLLSVLLLAALGNAGCVTFPKGVHPWAREIQKREDATEPTSRTETKTETKAAPKLAPSGPSVPQVNPDDVNDKNPRTTIRKLEAEIRHDEKSN